MLNPKKNKDSAPKKTYINLDDRGVAAEEIGTLIVVVLKAKNLNDKHFRKQDVYTRATLNGIAKKTPVEFRGGQHPIWDAELRFPILKAKKERNRKLEVACYSQEPHPLPDQLLGEAVVDLTEMLKTGEFDEWVELSKDGVQRGEVYLEMTYFPNTPEPVKPTQGAAATNKPLAVLGNEPMNLQRRPSKLSPAERLSTPIQTSELGYRPGSVQPSFEPKMPGAYPKVSYSPPKQQQQQLPNGGMLPPTQTPYSGVNTPPNERQDPLPSSRPQEPNALPSLLRPGGGRTPPSNSPISVPQLVPQATSNHYRYPSPAPPSQSPYLGPQFGTRPLVATDVSPYVGGCNPSPGTPSRNPYLSQSPSQNGLSYIWSRPEDNYASPPVLDPGIQGAGGFTLPVPVNTPAPDAFQGTYRSQSQIGYGYSRPTHVRSNSDSNPALIARYSSPLPLPPNANPRPPPSVPAQPPMSEPAPPYAPMLPPKATPPSPSQDTNRVEVLKRAEEDAKMRREQEIRDLELAMQLDRELNTT